ncbi:hypothetical protein GEMRC1_009376 [Eukaryota sp. GEM-RC1]
MSASPSTSKDISKQTWQVAEGILSELDSLETSNDGNMTELLSLVKGDREQLRALILENQQLIQEERSTNATLCGLSVEISLYKQKLEKLAPLL